MSDDPLADRLDALDAEGTTYTLEMSLDPAGIRVHVDGAEPEFFPEEVAP